MESLFVAWRLFLLASLIIFPQLLGILLYFRLRRAPRWFAVIVAALAPALVFFWLERIFMIAQLTKLYASGERCGMPLMGAVLLLFTGTAFHVVLGIIVQMVLWARRPKLA